MCVNVTTVIMYLLPGSATTNASVLGSETLRSTALLLTVLIALTSRSVATTLAITLGSTSGSWPRCANGLFVGGGDNFSWKVQPNQTRRCQKLKPPIVETD